MNKICINTSNLRGGGGVQVATSFLYKLSKSKEYSRTIDVVVSSVVSNELSKLNVQVNNFGSYKVFNCFAFKCAFKKWPNYDVIFTIFGPFYSFFYRGRSVVGFAQAWIISDLKDLKKSYSFLLFYKLRLKFFIQRVVFALNSDEFIVEAKFVKDALYKDALYKSKTTHIVSNSISQIFHETSNWEPVKFPKKSSLVLGYLGKNYAHKNTKLFPEIILFLRDKFGIHLDIFVTFSDEEWDSCSSIFRQHVTNIGPITIKQCPNFYMSVDGVISLSLLECFSVLPLEAIFMRRPLFLSDRRFHKDIALNYATYVDPLSVEDISNKIFNYYFSQEINKNLIDKDRGHDYINSLPSASDRFSNYIKILKDS